MLWRPHYYGSSKPLLHQNYYNMLMKNVKHDLTPINVLYQRNYRGYFIPYCFRIEIPTTAQNLIASWPLFFHQGLVSGVYF